MYLLLDCHIALIFSRCFQDIGSKNKETFNRTLNPNLEVFSFIYFWKLPDSESEKTSKKKSLCHIFWETWSLFDKTDPRSKNSCKEAQSINKKLNITFSRQKFQPKAFSFQPKTNRQKVETHITWTIGPFSRLFAKTWSTTKENCQQKLFVFCLKTFRQKSAICDRSWTVKDNWLKYFDDFLQNFDSFWNFSSI